jgi:tRNA pseudouridine55 synthase
MATGVLPILVGRAVKASEYLLCDDKEYIAGLQLGLTTDTEDVWGKTLTRCQTLPSKEEVLAVKERFLGDILQTPPMYSALKVGGQKLCDLARQNKEVERSPRPIHIYSLEIEPLDEENGLYRLKARVSKGTYIRTLCADIGAALGCGGVMATLRRTEAGGFPISDCVTLEELEAMDMDGRLGRLRPVEELFSDLEAVNLPDFYRTLCRNGCEIYLKKIGVSFPAGQRLRLCDASGRFFALGEVGDYEDGAAVKAIKIFVL